LHGVGFVVGVPDDRIPGFLVEVDVRFD